MRSAKVAASLLLLATLGWSGDVLPGGADRLEAFLARTRTLEAEFEQVLRDQRGVLIEESGGRFLLRRPDRFRWSYTRPYPQEIVADGQRVWLYDSELDQVTVRPLSTAIGNSPALLLSGDRALAEDFLISEQESVDGLDWVVLTPKSSESTFTRMRVGFDRQGLHAMELEDGFGQTTLLRFKAVRLNTDLDRSSFDFTPPEGADVIEDGG